MANRNKRDVISSLQSAHNAEIFAADAQATERGACAQKFRICIPCRPTAPRAKPVRERPTHLRKAGEGVAGEGGPAGQQRPVHPRRAGSIAVGAPAQLAPR
jgi:hypothetical protein